MLLEDVGQKVALLLLQLVIYTSRWRHTCLSHHKRKWRELFHPKGYHEGEVPSVLRALHLAGDRKAWRHPCIMHLLEERSCQRRAKGHLISPDTVLHEHFSPLCLCSILPGFLSRADQRWECMCLLILID